MFPETETGNFFPVARGTAWAKCWLRD